MRTFSDRRLLTGFSLVWAGLIIAVGLSFLTKNRMADSTHAVSTAHKLLLGFHRFESRLTRFETDTRGYISTGDEEFIEHLEVTRTKLWDDFLYLQKVTQDNRSQQARLDTIRLLTEQKLAFASRQVAARRQGRIDIAEQLLASKEGKILMDRIRDKIEESEGAINDLITEQSDSADAFNTRSTLLILASMLVSTFIGIITLILFKRLGEERERSVQGLRDFSNLLKGVFDSSQSGIMVFKAIRNSFGRVEDLEWVAVNDKACVLTNRSAESMTGHRLLQVSPGHLTNGLFDTYRSVIETGRPIEIERSTQLTNGAICWMTISISPITNGVAITFADITSRKEDAIRLEVSESNLQALINNTADEVWSVDRNLNIITANQAFRERQKPVETTDLWTRTLYRALNGERFTMEITVPREAGLRLMDYHFNPVISSDGSITGVAVFGQDITEKRNVEARIRHQSQVLSTILQNIPLLLFSIRPDGSIGAIEGKAMDIYGYKESDIVGMNMLDMYPNHQQALREALNGKPVHFTWVSVGTGPERYFDSYLFPDDNGLGTVTGVAVDITPLKQSEVELQEAKSKAEAASAFKTRFLANMSHEIRTPLSAILGFADILRREDKDGRHQEFLGHIESAGTTLLKLIGDILDLTKIEEGLMTRSEETFHLREVVASMLHPYQYRAQEKGLEFYLSFSGDMPDYVHGDSGKLIQVLVNLVGNALKFTQEGGIAVDIQGFTASDEETLLFQVSVTDSGIGIPEDKQDTVFNPFAQADEGIRRRFGGSGLGLSIAAEMVRILGGNLELESPAEHEFSLGNEGTRFYFTIPLKITEGAKDDDADTAPQDIRFHGMYRVLMVEDNPVNQRLAGLILAETGCQLRFADNGREGVEQALEHEFDLVFMDVQMPVMDGLTATRLIRERKPELPIVGLSANVYKEDIDACYEAGMTDFLPKPFSTDNLRAILRKHCPATAVIIETPRGSMVPTLPGLQGGRTPHLDYLKTLVGEDNEQIRSFTRAFSDVAEEFVSACQQFQPSQWGESILRIGKVAHKLKATLHIVGLDDLYPTLQTLEDAQRSPTPTLTQAQIEEVRRVFEDALEELGQLVLVYR